MTAGSHRIRRQCWQVRADSSAAALALRQTLRSGLDGALARAFERAFDALNLGERVLHLPRLTLSIRLQEGDDFIATLADLVEREVTERLQRLISDETGQSSPRPVTPKTSWREVLLAYLRDGTVPWHAATPQTTELLARLRESSREFVAEPRAVVNQLGADAEERSGRAFGSCSSSNRRPSPRFSKASRYWMPGEPLRVLRLRAAESVRTLDYPRLRAAAILVALRSSDLRAPRAPTVTAWMAECAAAVEQSGFEAFDSRRRRPSATGAERLAEGLTVVEQFEPGEARSVQHLPPPTSARPSAGARHPAADEVDAAIIVEPGAPEQSPRSTECHRGAPVTPEPSRRSTAASKTGPPITPPVADVLGAGGRRPLGMLVPHAGLVLLHPFLSQLFGAVGFHAGETASRRHTFRGAARCCTGSRSAEPKSMNSSYRSLKCCWACRPDPLAVADGLLSEPDRAEGDALLAAVVGHWAALGKTSTTVCAGRSAPRAAEDGGTWLAIADGIRSFDVLLAACRGPSAS